MGELEKLRKENRLLKEKIDTLKAEFDSYKITEWERETVLQAIEDSLGGIAIIDRDWNVKYVNPAVVKMWGYDFDGEMIGRASFEFFSEKSKKDLKKATKAIAKNGYWQGELFGKRKDGSSFSILVSQSVVKDKVEKKSDIIASCIETTEFKKALKDVADLEMRYSVTLDHLGDSIFVVDNELNVVLINNVLIDWRVDIGLEIDKMVGKNIFEILPFLPENVKSKYDIIFETGETSIFDSEFTFSGKRFVMETRMIPVFKGRDVDRVVTVMRDITVRKVVEEELRNSEEKYRLIADTVPVGVFIHVGGEIKYCGREGAHLLGYDEPEEIVGRNIIEFMHEDDREFVIDRARRRAAGEDEPSGYEVRMTKKDGGILPILIYGNTLEYMGEIAIQGVFIDISERKRVEKERERLLIKLKDSEEQYRTLVETSNDGICVVKDMKIVFFNKKLFKIMKYSEDEIRERTFVDFIHPDDVEMVADMYVRRRRGEDIPTTYEFRGVTKDGNVIPVETNIAMIDWEGGTAALCFIRNITERKEAEKLLRESEEKWRNLFENSMDSVFTADIKGNLISTNFAMEDLTGYKIDEMIGRNFREIMKTEEAEQVFEAYNHLFRTGEPIKDHIYNIRRKDGEERIIEGNVNVIKKDKKIIGFQGTFRDITEKRETALALKESEEKFRNFIESSKDVIYSTSIEGEFIDINPASETLFGYTIEELLRMNIRDLYKNKEDREKFQKEIEKKGFVKDYNILFMKKDKSPANCLLTSTLRKAEDGIIIGYHGIIRDITENRLLEEQLLQAQKMKAVGTLAGGMAHNFNNILVGIMGYSEYLLSKKKKDDPDYKALNTIYESTVKASDLTRQLLNIARGGDYKRVKVDLNSVVKRVIPLIKGTIDKTIEIVTDYDANLFATEGDVGQLEQCILNLCINSRDAMPDGGKIIIETKNQLVDERFVKTHLDAKIGNYVVLSIADTGTGIAPDILDHIFEPFFTTKKHAGGSGMGLATVYGIVKNLQGIITVYSEVGEGTTLRLYFPAIEGKIKMESLQQKDLTLKGEETILLVDDDDVVREMREKILREHGYQVIVSGSGKGAIEIVKERGGEIDMVILDVIMPDVGGKEVFERIIEIEPKMKVLVTSGYSKSGNAKDILDAGALGFIQKPASIQDLTKKTREILDGESGEENK